MFSGKSSYEMGKAIIHQHINLSLSICLSLKIEAFVMLIIETASYVADKSY